MVNTDIDRHEGFIRLPNFLCLNNKTLSFALSKSFLKYVERKKFLA